MAHADPLAGRKPETVAVPGAGGPGARRMSEAEVSLRINLPITPAKLLGLSPIQRRREDIMPRTSRRGLAAAGRLPGTLQRSSKEAQQTFTRAHASAVRAYGEGDQAYRAAYTELKRTFEKRGDHWIPKQATSPGA